MLGTGVLATTLAGAVAGGGVGAVIGGELGLGASEAWERTFAGVKGGAYVIAAHIDDAQTARAAHRILVEHLGEAACFDAQGRPIEVSV